MASRTSARKSSTLRWTLLAGASLIVLAGLLEPSPSAAQTTTTITASVTGTRTITGGNSLLITAPNGAVRATVDAAIVATGTVGSIVNAGTLSTFMGMDFGVRVTSGASVGSIDNSGLITLVGQGFSIDDGAVNTTIGTLSNSGLISSGGEGFYLSSGANIGTVANTGTVQAASTVFHVGLNAGSTIGTITNSGVTSGAQSLLNFVGGTVGAFTNSGTFVAGSTSTGGALVVDAAGAVLSSLINTGTITGRSGLTLNNGSIGTLVNGGLLQGSSSTGQSVLIAADGTLTSIGNTGTLAGDILNGSARALTITGGTGAAYGTLTGRTSGIAAAITSTGNLTLAGNNVLNGDVSVNSGAGTLTNTGTLYTERTTTITGAYNQGSATLAVGVTNGASHGALSVSGAATLTNGSIVMEEARTTLSGTPTLAGGTYTIVSAATSGTDYTGVSVTAPSFDGTVASTTTISGALNRLLVTLTPTTRLHWDGDAAGNAGNGIVDGGNGTWSSAGTNWVKSDGTSNGKLSGGTIIPVFQGTGGTVTVSGSVSAAGMTFGATGYRLTGGTIGLTASPSTIVANNGVTATIASSLTGSGGLYKHGVGELVLSGVNSFSGGTSINAGTLTLLGGAALSDSEALAVLGNGTLTLGASETVGALSGDGVIQLGANTLTSSASTGTTITGPISGTGGLVKAGTGTLTLSGTNSYTGGTSITGGTLVSATATALAGTGAVAVGSGAAFQIDATQVIGALSGAGSVLLGANTLTAGDAANTTLSGAISGSGGFTKAGSGTLTLSGANSFTGGTSLAAGTLVVNGSIGVVSIAPGATLSGSGTTGAIANNGTIALGSAALTAGGNITGTGAITFTIGSGGSGYIVNTSNTANYTPGAGTVTVTPTLSGVTISNGATVALIRGNAGSTAPGFTGTTVSVTSTGVVSWVAAAGTAYAGTVDLNGYTIAANDTVLVASAPVSPPAPPPAPPVVTTPTETAPTTPIVTTPTTPTTPVVTTPTTPAVTPTPPVVAPPTVRTGVIDSSKPTFDNEDGAVKTTTVTFDGGTLKPTAPLTLTQTVNVEATNGVIDPNGSTVTLSGPVTGAGRLTVNGSGALVVSNTLSNSGGLNVQSGGLTVAGGGTVSAPVSVSGGLLSVTQGGNVSAPVTVSGGAVTVADGGRVSAPVTVGNGAVTIDNGGTLAASMTVESGGTAKVNGAVTGAVTVATGATLGGSGLIGGSTSVSGILAPGNSPGTLVFTAPVTLNATSLYQVEIDGTGTGTGAGNHDQVVVRGAAFTAGGRLTPVLRGIGGAATNSFTPSLGQSFTVVSADGGVSGRFDRLDQPASGLAAGTRLDLLYGSNAVALVATPASYANLGAAGLAQSSNQRSVGAALESFRPAAGGPASSAPAQALFDTLHTLTGDRIAPALDQLSGRIHADTLAAERVNRRMFGRAIEARQASGRGGPAVAEGVGGVAQFVFDGEARSIAGLPESPGGGTGAATGRDTGVWGRPMVAVGRNSGDGSATRRTGGFLVGTDHAFDPAFKAGVALGFLRTKVTANDGLGNGTVDSYQATAYASWTPGAVFVDGALGYGYSRTEASRSIGFGAVAGAAEGETDGRSLSAELSAGSRMTLGGAWVEPRAGLRWDRLRRDGFTEHGTSLLALTEEGETENALRSSVGLRAGTRLNLNGTLVEPTGLLAWEHDWRDAGSTASASLNGARFTTRQAGEPGRDAAVLGAGVSVTMTQALSMQVGYVGELRRNDTSHALSAGLRWAW